MVCTKCKLNKLPSKFYTTKTGYVIKQCKKCRSQTSTKRTSIWRRAAKKTLIMEFGGKCSRCGYSKSFAALQFHHINPEEKKFELGHYGKSLKRLREEARKCVLLCANCHCEVEESLRIAS